MKVTIEKVTNGFIVAKSDNSLNAPKPFREDPPYVFQEFDLLVIFLKNHFDGGNLLGS